MSAKEFIEETLRENSQEIDDLIKLKEIIEQLPKEENQIYFATVTSNL